MARQTPILVPDMCRVAGNMFIQKPVAPDSSNSFKAGALLYLVSGVLTLIPSDGVLIYGQTPDIQHASTDLPPTILPRPVGEGENHYVFGPEGAEFEINIGALSSNALVIGSSAKVLADVTLGTQYGIATPTSGAYAGIQVLDPTETSALLFQVTGFVDGTLSTDYNPRVRVKIIPSKIQN